VIDPKILLAISKRNTKESQYNKKVFDNEAKFQTYVLKRLKQLPKNRLKVFKTMKSNEMGVSDLILCVDGKFVAIELKHKGNQPTEHQRLFIEAIRLSGGLAGCAWSWADVKYIIDSAGFDIDAYEIAKIQNPVQ
jgi:hypothetical protein